MKLKDRVAVITGAAAGIGRATAVRFAQEGARLALFDVAEREGRELAADLRSQYQEARFYRVDVSAPAEVEAAVEQAVSDFGSIDILINNAGILRDSTLLKMSVEDWEQVIRVNLNGVFHCTRAVARRMVEQGGGRIVNASSVVALHGNFGQSNYVAAKAGVIGLTRTWARELGPKGICVNAVAPGFIETEMVQTIPPEILEKGRRRIPLGRMGKPEEVAGVYLFLAGSDADYVNGAVISVDGGLTG